MKIKLRKSDGFKSVSITGDYIKLDSLLKFTGIADTGGEAKAYITGGEVFVNGLTCIMRGRKIRPGDVVRYGGVVIKVRQK